MIIEMKKFFLVLALATLTTFGFAATVYTSPATGSANWASIPWTTVGSGSPITYIIQSNYTANMNIDVSGIDSLFVYGIFDITQGNKDLTMNANGYIQVIAGGSITGGNSSNQIYIGAITNNGTFAVTGPAYSSSSTAFTSGTALPVTWHSFTSKKIDNTIQLTWSTASELNNSHFEIERASEEGVFYTIGSASGNGTTQLMSKYTFTDIEPINTSAYYRIKQIDYNGDFDYSTIIKVKSEEINPIIVWPTVLNNNNSVLNIKNASEFATVKIFDAKGREINKSNNINATSEALALNLQKTNNNLSGFYFLYITDNNKTTSFKILVQ